MDEWEASLASREDLSKSEINRRCLSRETLEGLRITGYFTFLLVLAILFLPVVHSFVELTKYLLDQPGVFYFLSEKLCQDPLESFFGKQ